MRLIVIAFGFWLKAKSVHMKMYAFTKLNSPLSVAKFNVELHLNILENTLKPSNVTIQQKFSKSNFFVFKIMVKCAFRVYA